MTATCRQCRFGNHDHCAGSAWDEDHHVVCACWKTHDYEAPEVFPDDWDTAGAETRYERMMGDR